MNHLSKSTLVLISIVLAGCANENAKQRDYHTSGNREADQRAEQRVAQAEQIRGDGDKGGKKADGNAQTSLFERIGGQKSVQLLVSDFVDRAIADPRVNFERKGITKGGVLGIGDKPAEWKPTKENVAVVKKHIVQFLTLAMGGPAIYDGLEMKSSHAGMKITNAEFDACVGDMKASLDAMKVPTTEQKEVLAILESTRAQIVEQR